MIKQKQGFIITLIVILALAAAVLLFAFLFVGRLLESLASMGWFKYLVYIAIFVVIIIYKDVIIAIIKRIFHV